MPSVPPYDLRSALCGYCSNRSNDDIGELRWSIRYAMACQSAPLATWLRKASVTRLGYYES